MNRDTPPDSFPIIPPPHEWMLPHNRPKKIIPRKMSGICTLCQPPCSHPSGLLQSRGSKHLVHSSMATARVATTIHTCKVAYGAVI